MTRPKEISPRSPVGLRRLRRCRNFAFSPLGLSVTEAAEALGVSRKTLSSILNGRSGISPEMAVRLSIAFNTTAESWLRQQLRYDLARAEAKRRSLQVRKPATA